MEAERREIERAEPLDQRPLLGLADDVFAIAKAGDQRRVEQQAHAREQLLELGRPELGRELVERALPRVLVGPPAQEAGAVAEAAAGHLVVAHFDDQHGLQRLPCRRCARCSSGSGRRAHCR